MAIEMRAAMVRCRRVAAQGREIGFGVGIARGYAALGQIGFADRIDYTAIGTVCNLAARLCAEAEDGQILMAAGSPPRSKISCSSKKSATLC